MATYLLQASCCWFLFYGIYYTLLRQRTFYQYNRWFLLATLVGGLLLPLLPDYLSNQGSAEQLLFDLPVIYVGWLDPVYLEASIQEASVGAPLWRKLLLAVYFIGVLAFSARLGYGFFRLFQIKKTAKKESHTGYNLLVSEQVPSPFSFFTNIYWNPRLDMQQTEGAAILAHELAHVRRGHSLDVLLIEFIQVFLWFHPLLPLIKRSIRNVHEYQADADVLKQVPVRPYGQILLYQARYNDPQLLLVNHFFTTQIKQRIMMMTRKPSSKRQLWAYALAMPALVMMSLFFLQTQAYAENNPSNTAMSVQVTAETDPDQMPVFPGCEDAGETRQQCSNQKLISFIIKNLKYPQTAKKEGVEGMALISFKINADGKVVDATIEKDPGAGCGAEALRIVNEMPTWKPGLKDGKPVAVEMKLPFKFKLDDKDQKRTSANEVDEMPVFASCTDDLTGDALRKCSNQELFAFVGKNLRYPEAAVKEGVEGMVVVEFKVGKDGAVSAAKILKGIGAGCDEEVMRVVYSTNWKPALKDGKAVETEMRLPIKFAMGNAAEMNKSTPTYDLPLADYRLAPNPSTGEVSINFKGEKGSLSVRIFNNTGQMVFEDQQAQFDGFFQKDLDLKVHGAGLYFLQIRQSGKVFMDKIVVQ